MHFDKLPNALSHLRSHDPEFRLHGALGHRYTLNAPLSGIDAIESQLGFRLPDDYRTFLSIGNGGAGPYYGILPFDPAGAQGVFPATEAWLEDDADFMTSASEAGTVALGHVGCGYFAILVVNGPARGQVWYDVRGVGEGYYPAYRSFGDYYGDWIRLATSGQALSCPAPEGLCALPSVLGSYTAETLRPGAIRIQTMGTEIVRYFDDDDDIHMCPRCHALVTAWARQGSLRVEHFVPGLLPRGVMGGRGPLSAF